jgi:hypothetical protein
MGWDHGHRSLTSRTLAEEKLSTHMHVFISLTSSDDSEVTNRETSFRGRTSATHDAEGEV